MKSQSSDLTVKRVFSELSPSLPETQSVSIAQAARGNQKFHPLPPPTGQPPFRLSLDTVLSAEQIAEIKQAKRIVFHVAGDTGGVKKPEPQRIVAIHMEKDIFRRDRTAKPSFLYHLGDVVYFFGEAREYFPQFYDPYIDYPAPIFAIPGNHDGDVQDPSQSSLAAFMTNFCSATPRVSPDAGESSRHAMTQPNCYWTLEAPFLTIIGLYTNVPEGGELQPDQFGWLTSELKSAPKNNALLVAMHHPIYSLEKFHTGSAYMGNMLDQAIKNSGRVPHMVLAGHVHNYQRFRRKIKGRNVPYVVAGAAGYWHLHNLPKNQGHPILTPHLLPKAGVILESYCDDRHGFLRLEITPQTISGEYFAVPRSHESWSGPAKRTDAFEVSM